MIRAAIIAACLACPVAAREIAPDALDGLPQVDILVLGEVHDNAEHHVNQARAVAAIQPAALVFEMLLPDQVRRMPDDRGNAAAMDRALGWSARGWPDFAMYHPIFTAAPRARIYGADVPQADLARAMADGAASVLRGFELDQALPPDQQAAREADLWAAHCFAMPKDLMGAMVEAQRLRDASLARAALRALRETGGPVVVITGTEHARTDIGVPAVINRVASAVTVLSVGQFEAAQDDNPPFDVWLVTEGVAGRDDPCAGFGSTTG